MHIDVNDILQQGEGAQADYGIEGELPELADVELAGPVSGDVRIIGTKEGVLADGRMHAQVQLECHRCLRTFTHSMVFPLQAEFADAPSEDQYSISKHGKIDLSEPLRQEIIVHLPLQQLCQADCNGIELKQKKDSNGSSQEADL